MQPNNDAPAGQVDVFWGEIAPCEHLVQIYESDQVYLDSLEGFVGGGIRSGDGVIVIATAEHLTMLEERLCSVGVDLGAARSRGQYFPMDAQETLAKFLVQGWPDEELFTQLVSGVLQRARANGRAVRAVGELVALMWERGHQSATIRLEHIWHALCQRERFSLFCLYPRIGITEDVSESILKICATHSKVVGGSRTKASLR